MIIEVKAHSVKMEGEELREYDFPFRADRFETYQWNLSSISSKNFRKKLDSLILFLDEFDFYLSDKKNDFGTLAYLFSRSLPNAFLILATNKFWIYDYLNEKLDSRIQDTFSKRLKVISFSDYTEDELFGILLNRAKVGFREGNYSEDVLEYIAI